MRIELETALAVITSEIERKQITQVQITTESEHLCISLEAEGRVLWVGYGEGKGYFLTFDKSANPSSYFELENIANQMILSLASTSSDLSVADASSSRPDMTDTVKRLLVEIGKENPNPADVKKILDEIPTSERGLDAFATLAMIKSCRQSVDKLRALISRHDVLEVEYQKLLSSNPWMLGSQYKSVVVQEYWMWMGARVDLMLMSAVGYIDIVELKRPNISLLAEASHKGIWRASVHLSEAIAQARNYIRVLDENRDKIEDKLNLPLQSVSRMYRSGVIVIGGQTPEQKEARDALREFSTSDPRIVILTYDDLLAIAEATVALFERKLDPPPKTIAALIG